MKLLKSFYVIITIIVLSILSCSEDISIDPIKDFTESYTKATHGAPSTHHPTVVPEGTVSYNIEPYKPAV